MTVNDILRRVQWAAGDSTGHLIDLANVCDLINDAQTELNQEAKINQVTTAHNLALGGTSFTIVSGVGIQSIMRIGIPDWSLTPIQYEQVIASDPLYGTANQRTGKPKYYWVASRKPFAGQEETKINVYPTSDAAYVTSVVANEIPTPVANGNDNPGLPFIFHPLVARMCFAAIKERDEDFEAAAYIKADCISKAVQLVGSVLNPQEESYPVVRDVDNVDRQYSDGFLYD